LRSPPRAPTLNAVDLNLTLILIGGFALFAIFCGWRGSRPPQPPKVRMAPWRFLMVLSAAVLSILLIHAVALLSGSSTA
jgi:hypothetical protein